MTSLAIVIVSYNAAEVLLRTIAAARKAAEGLAHEIIVVDNDSPDGSADRVAATFPGVRLFRRPNLGFAAGVNHGVAATAADTILLLNPDCFVDAAALSRCIETLESSRDIAAVSCRMVDGDGKPMLDARPFPTLRTYLAERLAGARPPYPDVPSPPRPVDIDSATGAFVLIARDAWSAVGPFDDGFFLYFEETEWFWRAKRAGFRVVQEPRATVVHLGAQSTRKGVGGSPVVAENGMLLRAALDSRERYWRLCYGAAATLGMRAATLALALLSIAMLLPRLAPRRTRAAAKARLPGDLLRVRHALHLAGPPLNPGRRKAPR